MAHKRRALHKGADEYNAMIDDPSSKDPMLLSEQQLSSNYVAMIRKKDLNKGKEPKMKLRNKAQALYWYLKKLEGIISDIRENETAAAVEGGHNPYNEKMCGLLLYDDDIRRNYNSLLDYLDMYKAYMAKHDGDEDLSEDWNELADCLALDFADKRTLDQRVQACITYLEGDANRAAMHQDSMGERYVAAVKFLAKEVMAVKTVCGRQASPPTGPEWHWSNDGLIGAVLEDRLMRALRPAQDLLTALSMDRRNVNDYKRRKKFPLDGDHELDLAMAHKWEKAKLWDAERKHAALMADCKSGPGGGYSFKMRLNGGGWKRDAKYAPPNAWRQPKTHFGRFGCGDPYRSGPTTYGEMTQLILCLLSSHPKASCYDGCRAVALETPSKYQQWNMTRVLVLPTDGTNAKTMILGAKYLRPYIPPQIADITPSVIVDDGDYYR